VSIDRSQPMIASDIELLQQRLEFAEFEWNRATEGMQERDAIITSLKARNADLESALRCISVPAYVAAMKARIAELEANEKAYEDIIGPKTYREVADRIQELEGALRELFDQPTENPLRMTPEQREKLWVAHARARAALQQGSAE
jgi:hypothetical protein